MRVATWNVNGIRARAAQFSEWLKTAAPDIVCLQEIKATPAQVPELLFDAADYWVRWHGAGGYSGVALLIRRNLHPHEPMWEHPAFDHETRVVTAEVAGITVASVYVPNGGKDFAAKMHFLAELKAYAASMHAAAKPLLLCGDLNVARADIDVHPKERKPLAIGQLPVEREAFESMLQAGLVDVARELQPDNDAMFTWWAPWRNLKQRNIGWRIDYILASPGLAARVRSVHVAREVGTSDHGPLIAEME